MENNLEFVKKCIELNEKLKLPAHFERIQRLEELGWLNKIDALKRTNKLPAVFTYIPESKIKELEFLHSVKKVIRAVERSEQIIDELFQKDEVKENDKKYSLKKFVDSIKFLFPRRNREEILGDLLETIHEMKEEGLPFYWQVICTITNIAHITYAGIFFKIESVVSQKETKEQKEVSK